MPLNRLKSLGALALIATLFAALAACAAPQKPAAGAAPESEAAPALAPVRAELLLQSEETILGEPIVYPAEGPARITMAIVIIEPGARTGWHTHGAPLAAYMLDGELTVTYQGEGARVYRAGDALVEAMAVSHEGHNRGRETVRILAVFAGSTGTANTLPDH